MRLKTLRLAVLALAALGLVSGCTGGREAFPKLSGPYLGQTPPGDTAQLFAPGLMNIATETRDMAMTPEGKEIYYTLTPRAMGLSCIMVTREVNGRWTKPEVAAFSGHPGVSDVEPFVSPDGRKFYFVSSRADAEGSSEKADWDIWVMDREGEGWSLPRPMDAPVNSEHNEFFPSLTRDGTIYFSRALKGQRVHHIYRSRLVDGKYTEPEKLPEQVNCGTTQFNAFIDPDERYIIVPVAGRRDSQGGVDYYIVFRNDDDTWSQPVNMGPQINTPAMTQWSPYVTPDGKYFFFHLAKSLEGEFMQDGNTTWSYIQNRSQTPESGNANMYWIGADVIDSLKTVADGLER